MSGYDRFLTLADELRSVIQSMRKKIDRRLPNLSNGGEFILGESDELCYDKRLQRKRNAYCEKWTEN